MENWYAVNVTKIRVTKSHYGTPRWKWKWSRKSKAVQLFGCILGETIVLWDTPLTLGSPKYIWLSLHVSTDYNLKSNCLFSLFTLFKVFSFTLINVNLTLNYLHSLYFPILSWVYPIFSIFILFLRVSFLLVLFFSLLSLFPISPFGLM